MPPGTTLRDCRRSGAWARERWEAGTPVPGGVPEMIARGWGDMLRLGVSRRGGDPVRATAAELQRQQDDLRLQLVLRAAKREFFGVTRGMLAIADDGALVLDAWGDRRVAKRAEHAGLAARTVWSNLTGGLNGIGCAACGRGGVIFAEQHWREDQFCLVCTVWPIRHRNQVIAVINVTDFWHNVYPYTLLALRLFAKDVERALAIQGRQELARTCAAVGWPERGAVHARTTAWHRRVARTPSSRQGSATHQSRPRIRAQQPMCGVGAGTDRVLENDDQPATARQNSAAAVPPHTGRRPDRDRPGRGVVQQPCSPR